MRIVDTAIFSWHNSGMVGLAAGVSLAVGWPTLSCRYESHPPRPRQKGCITMSHRLAIIARSSLPCVVFLWLVTPALAENAMPLADIRTADGQAAKIETTKSGFLVNNASEIVARVVAAPDAFLCRVAPGGNRDVVQLSIGRVESLRCDSLYSPSRDKAITFKARARGTSLAKRSLSAFRPRPVDCPHSSLIS